MVILSDSRKIIYAYRVGFMLVGNSLEFNIFQKMHKSECINYEA